MSNCRTPTAMSPNNTPHASLQNSRMGTPATTYGAFGAGSMPGSSNASGSVVVSRALVVDWDIDVPLEADGRVASGFNQTLQVPNHSQQNSGTVSCTSGADGTISDGLNIRVNLGYAADVELRLFGQTEATAPFINLYSEGNNMPEFNISARTLHPLITTSSSSHRNDHSWTAPLLLSFSITASREYAPPTIYESASPAAYHRLSNFLDQPGGHDVVFCFPENKHLYADRYILQRCSPYFRRLFQASPQRGAVVVPPLESPTAQNLRSPSTPRGSEGSGSGGAATDDGFESEDITLQNFDDVQTPGTSVPPSSSGGEYPGVSDPTRIPLPRDSPPAAQSYTLQRDQTPLVDDNIFVIDIKETSFNTMRAVLYYLYTDFITFAPLTSCFHNIHPFPARTSKTPRTEAINAEDEAIERRRLAARNAVVGEYMQNHPCRPVPVSPKSVYAIAKKYEIPALETQALIRITTVSERDPIVAISELFSPFSRVHGSARIPQLETVIASWENVVRRSGEWEVVRSRCVKVADTYFSGILCEILDRLP